MKDLTFKQLKTIVEKNLYPDALKWHDVPGTVWFSDPRIPGYSTVDYEGETIPTNELERIAWERYEQDCEESGKVPSKDEFNNLPMKFFKSVINNYLYGVDESTFVKGKRMVYDKMSFRELIINFFAHWTGYASGGRKSGTSGNPIAQRLDNYLYEHYREWSEGYGDHLAYKLMKKVMEIEKKYGEVTYASAYNIGRMIKKAWPEIEKFLETTKMINDKAKRENLSMDDLMKMWGDTNESKSNTITFSDLKKIVCEGYYDSEDGNRTWIVEYYSKKTGEYLGNEFIEAKSAREARQKFFEFKHNVVSLDYNKSYSTDELEVPLDEIIPAKGF